MDSSHRDDAGARDVSCRVRRSGTNCSADCSEYVRCILENRIDWDAVQDLVKLAMGLTLVTPIGVCSPPMSMARSRPTIAGDGVGEADS